MNRIMIIYHALVELPMDFAGGEELRPIPEGALDTLLDTATKYFGHVPLHLFRADRDFDAVGVLALIVGLLESNY